MEHTYFLKAQELDAKDILSGFRSEFHIPKNENGEESIYLCGNSLGLMPKKTTVYINEELADWSKLGVEGHLHAKHPWMPYHEFLTENMAELVGALPKEVVVMNSLTVNLHLLMVSFYRPTKSRFKILLEYSPFPSDRYAVGPENGTPASKMMPLCPGAVTMPANSPDLQPAIARSSTSST